MEDGLVEMDMCVCMGDSLNTMFTTFGADVVEHARALREER